MRRAVAFSLIALLGVVSIASATEIVEPIGARYVVEPNSSFGALTIANAQGEQFTVVNSQSMVVASGVASSEMMTFWCTHSGPDASGILLRVYFQGGCIALTSDDGWEWMH